MEGRVGTVGGRRDQGEQGGEGWGFEQKNSREVAGEFTTQKWEKRKKNTLEKTFIMNTN